MISILLGPDDFSKTEYVGKLSDREKIQVEIFFDPENLPNFQNLSQQDLFSTPKIFVLKGLLKFFTAPEVLDSFIASKNHILFFEEKLDKRSSDNKRILANTQVPVKQFELPHGNDLNSWLINRAKFYNANFSPKATEALAVKLGRDDAKETKIAGKVISTEEVYNLWQADSELQKLSAFALGKEINPEDVTRLSSDNREVDVFDLTNAIADNQKQQALELLNGFLLQQSSGDEKTAIIQLNALMAEQFRNVAMVQDFLSRKTSEPDILEKTGWKSGRLFVTKKIANRFPQKKILDFLTKLMALDDELKTSNTPPKVLLDLIVSQLLI